MHLQRRWNLGFDRMMSQEMQGFEKEVVRRHPRQVVVD
jgi:hypothetical protein